MNSDGANPSFEQQVGGPVGGSAVEEGGRAAGISGAMLGLLMVASSLMWALYRLKPGVLRGDKWEVVTDPNISAPLYSGRKSVSTAGAANVKVSPMTTEFDSGFTAMADMNAEKMQNVMSLSLITSPVPSSNFQDSAGLFVEMRSGTNMTKAGMHQEASHLTLVSGGNASVYMNMDSNLGANSGRGQMGSQVVTSGHQEQSVTVVREFHSSAGTSHSQEASQFSKARQVASGGQFVGSNAGGIVVSTDGSRNISQNVSEASALKTNAGTSEKSGAVVIVSNFGGNAVKNQENSSINLSSHQVTSGTGDWTGIGAVRTNEASGMLASDGTSETTTVHSVTHRTTVGTATGQDALSASASDQRTARGMALERADLGQQRSAVMNSSQKKTFSTDSGILEGKSGTVVIQSNFGGTSGGCRDGSQLDVAFHKTTNIVESDVRLGRVGLSQENSELMANFNHNLSSNVIRYGGGVGEAGSGQQKSMTQTSSVKFSSDGLDLGNTEENMGTVVIHSNVGGKSRDKSQVDVAFHKTTGRAVVEEATATYARRTETSGDSINREYSVGQVSSLGHRPSAAGVDVSKYDLTRTSLKANAASCLDAPITKESERSEELLTTSATRTFTSRTLSPSALSEIKSTTSYENRNLSSDRKGAMTMRVQPSTQTFGAEYSASFLQSESIEKCLSLDRSIASVKGNPPKTVKVQSPVRNTALPVLLITSSESGGTRVHASLERSTSLVRGQPPKTIRIESPVSPPVAGFSPSSRLDAPSLERSSSIVKGELPRKLKIESPGRHGGIVFHGSTSSSPNMVNVSDASFQKSSFFTTHSAVSSFDAAGFSGLHGSGEFNVQLPNSSQTTRRYQIQNLSLSGGLYPNDFPPAFEAPQFSGSTETAHVECILLTTDGQYLVSGSVSGPPQVWNMEVVRI